MSTKVDVFSDRHIGPNDKEIREMLKVLGFSSLDEFTSAIVPKSIRVKKPLELPEALTEYDVLRELKNIASKNLVFRNYLGLGYSDTITPPVILRNIMENPGWYTQYTPYQAEIAQGRLEALLNFQTLISDMTKMDIANASMLDEATAAYQKAVSLVPQYADAHYNLALSYERQGQRRRALRHWLAYVRLDPVGPWANHAKDQARKILNTEKLSIVSRRGRLVKAAG